MITAHEIWNLVEKRASAPRRSKLQGLLKFLQSLDNPHAMILSDRITEDACDKQSAQALEAMLVGALSATVNKFCVAEWLRLCFDAIAEFNRHGHNLYPTRLADVARPATSPFSRDSMARQRNVDAWRQALYDWLVDKDENKSPEDWLAAIAISAAVHGFMLDALRLNNLVSMLQANVLPAHDDEGTYVLFNLPFQGLGNHNTVRWFVDPVTEMLIWRYAKLANRPTGLKAEKLITNFLKLRIKPDFLPTNLGDFLSRMITWWSVRAAPIDVQCAARSLITHSINERSWARLHELPFSVDPQTSRHIRKEVVEVSDDFDTDDILLLHPWLNASLCALALPTRQEAKSAVDALISAEPADGTASIFLGWLSDMLAGLSATKVKLNLSTILHRYEVAAPRLMAMFGGDDIRALKIHELEDIYAELMSDPDPAVPASALASGIRDFHGYLHRRFGIPFITSEAEIFGEQLALKPVDASILTFDEYVKAQQLLNTTRGNKRDIQASKIVLMLAFKLGMRRMEIFGLLLSDLQLAIRPTCLVQKNPKRRLKTDSSRRVLPLSAFLAKAEMGLLSEWINSYRTKASGSQGAIPDDPYFFLGFSGDPDEYWTKKITTLAIGAMRQVTGDEQLYLHHLRHSFATWTYLRLRAPDFPEIYKHFEGCSATSFKLRTGTRLRVLLYSRDPGASRTYTYAASRLLGHSSPLTSFGHYIHSSDLIIGNVAKREVERLPVGILLAASGLQKSAAYENLGESMTSLLTASQRQFMPDTAKRPKIAAPRRGRGRAKLSPVLERGAWIPLDMVNNILEGSIKDKMAISTLSEDYELDPKIITELLKRANDYGKSIGIDIDQNGMIKDIPLKIHRLNSTAEFCKKLEYRLAEMSVRAPILYTEGIKIYLDHYDHEKKDVVFRGEKDLLQLEKFLMFMRSLGCLEHEFSWVLRTVDSSCNTLPLWFAKVKTKWKPANIKCIKPKKAASASSYKKWLGILPILEDGTSIGLPVANKIFLASLTNKISTLTMESRTDDEAGDDRTV